MFFRVNNKSGLHPPKFEEAGQESEALLRQGFVERLPAGRQEGGAGGNRTRVQTRKL